MRTKVAVEIKPWVTTKVHVEIAPAGHVFTGICEQKHTRTMSKLLGVDGCMTSLSLSRVLFLLTPSRTCEVWHVNNSNTIGMRHKIHKDRFVSRWK